MSDKKEEKKIIMEDDDEKLRIKRDVLNNKNAGCTVD